MMRSTWRVLAFGALVGAVALPASAQVVVGGSGAPSVEVNWAVLDQLGRQPTLADMLKSEPPAVETRPAGNQPDKAKGVQYRPYKAGAPPHATPPKPVKPT
ncbi:MAG TPA: lysophospholipase, partial [Magnetospirillum sp.]|nr:lysophospholipase [Magnetospirillum sp.]